MCLLLINTEILLKYILYGLQTECNKLIEYLENVFGHKHTYLVLSGCFIFGINVFKQVEKKLTGNSKMLGKYYAVIKRSVSKCS